MISAVYGKTIYDVYTAADVHSDEVCQMETFHATCPTDHVIAVESAQLGRLKIGKYAYDYVLVSTNG